MSQLHPPRPQPRRAPCGHLGLVARLRTARRQPGAEQRKPAEPHQHGAVAIERLRQLALGLAWQLHWRDDVPCWQQGQWLLLEKHLHARHVASARRAALCSYQGSSRTSGSGNELKLLALTRSTARRLASSGVKPVCYARRVRRSASMGTAVLL